MSSEQEVSDIVSKLSSNEVFEKIDEHLPEIITFLETEMCSSNFATVLQILFKDGMKHFDVASVQLIFLQDILNLTQKIFNDCVESIKFNLDTESANSPADTEFSLNQLLKVALDILDGYSSLLRELDSLDSTLRADLLDSVPKTIITVTGEAFVHCRDSESVYGRYFANCTTRLTNLFRKSFEVQTVLLRVLDEKFSFQSKSEDDICLLLLVLDKVVEIGEIVCGFELSAIVDQWKGFVKLTAKYSESLQSRLSLGPVFSVLTASLDRIFNNISSQAEGSSDRNSWLNRHMKLANFVLKVVIKLCEVFNSSLSGQPIQLLLELLINLHGEDQALAQDSELSPMFKSYVTVGASPLLSHLISDPAFVSEYRRRWCGEDCRRLRGMRKECRLGALALTVNLARKLVKCPPEIQRLWLDQNFILSTVNIVAVCCVDMKVALTVDERDGYCSLVGSCAVLVTSLLDTESFQKLEADLFRSYFHQNFFAKLYIEDFLCLLARLTCESVVIGWLDWLDGEVMSIAPYTSNHPLLVHISSLRARLVTFLSPRARRARILTPPSLQPHSLTPHSTLTDFNALVEWLERWEPAGGGEELVEWDMMQSTLVSLWLCLSDTRPPSLYLPTPALDREASSKSSLWWTRLLAALSSATSTTIPRIHNIQTVLDSMARLSDGCTDTSTQLSIISVIKSLTNHSVLPSGPVTDDYVSQTACQILLKFTQVSRPLIKVVALETLFLLNQSELHCYNLNRALSDFPDLSSEITDYFNGCTTDHTSAGSQDIFPQESTADFVHKCLPAVAMPQRVIEPPAKKPKMSTSHEINQLVAKSKLVYKDMKRCLDEQTLSDSQKTLLSDLISQYQSLKSYL